jgi:hypothetical protein
MAATGWKRSFDEPIPLPRGRQLVTLEDAGRYITKLPKGEHEAAGVAGRNGGLDPGRDARRPDDVCAYRRHEGAESPRRAHLQSGPQGPSLGQAEAAARPVTGPGHKWDRRSVGIPRAFGGHRPASCALRSFPQPFGPRPLPDAWLFLQATLQPWTRSRSGRSGRHAILRL